METPNLHLPQEVITLMFEKGAKLNRWGNVLILNDLRVAGFCSSEPEANDHMSIRLMQEVANPSAQKTSAKWEIELWRIEFSSFVPAEVIVAALNAIL